MVLGGLTYRGLRHIDQGNVSPCHSIPIPTDLENVRLESLMVQVTNRFTWVNTSPQDPDPGDRAQVIGSTKDLGRDGAGFLRWTTRLSIFCDTGVELWQRNYGADSYHPAGHDCVQANVAQRDAMNSEFKPMVGRDLWGRCNLLCTPYTARVVKTIHLLFEVL